MKNMHRRLIAFLCLLFLWGFLFSGRLNALEALGKIKEISTKVVTRTGDDIPDGLVGNDMARRYFPGVVFFHAGCDSLKQTETEIRWAKSDFST